MKWPKIRQLFYISLVLLAIGLIAHVLHGETSTSALQIIREKCLKCHTGDKPAAGLRLDTVDAMVRGGKHGPAVVPYKPDESLIYKAITGEVVRMPPFYQLEESEVAVIRRWIYQGAQQSSMGGREP